MSDLHELAAGRDAELTAARNRIAELERQNAELRKAAMGTAASLVAAAPKPEAKPDDELKRDAERWRLIRELDSGAIYKLLAECDGIHPELADAAADAAINAAMKGARRRG